MRHINSWQRREKQQRAVSGRHSVAAWLCSVDITGLTAAFSIKIHISVFLRRSRCSRRMFRLTDGAVVLFRISEVSYSIACHS